MKRASADIWWIIIGAVIALIVMIVMMMIFTGKTQPLAQGLSNCEGKGGVCVGVGNDCPLNTIKVITFDCKENKECCLGNPITSPSECSAKGDSTEFRDGYCYAKKT